MKCARKASQKMAKKKCCLFGNKIESTYFCSATQKTCTNQRKVMCSAKIHILTEADLNEIIYQDTI